MRAQKVGREKWKDNVLSFLYYIRSGIISLECNLQFKEVYHKPKRKH